jgi:uncharacterized repeat protein (TIGR02059 family)
MFKSLASRSLVAAIIATTVMIAPLPLSMGSASAATFLTTEGTYIIEKITWSCACSVSSTKPPALSSFDVKVDGVPNPVTAFSVFGSAVIDLTLTTTVYSGSVITFSYNAPDIDNTLTNNALQKTDGEDYVSFTLEITNLGGSRPEPNTPGVATVVAGIEEATITVTAPTSGRTPTSYVVTATPGGKTCTVTGASGSCIITGLTAGTAYTFTTIAKVSTGDSSASAASASVTVLARTPSWGEEPLTDSETDANTIGYMPTSSSGNIIITDEFGFTLDKKNGIKPKIRMKNYAGKIKLSISATYKVGTVTKKYKCAFASFGTTKKIKTAKWRWYSPKKACTVPTPLVAAIRANTATLSTSGKWVRQSLTTGKKVRADKTKIKPRTLKYTIKGKPATIK